MSARNRSTKPSAFNHSYSLVPGPTSQRALAAALNNIAINSGVPKSNFAIKKGFATRGGQYAIIVVKGKKLPKSGKEKQQVENRNEANYEKLRNRIKKAIFGGNARNRSNALGLATMFSKGIRTGNTARNNVFRALGNKIFTMAYPKAGHKGNFRKTARILKNKSVANRTAVGGARFWNP